MSVEFPTRPADIPATATLHELVVAHQVHAARLTDAAYGIGEVLPGDVVAAHAVAALATQHAIAARALATRWCTVRDALTYGATVPAVAAAMDLDVVEVVAGLRSWADRQLREQLMTPAEHGAMYALVDTEQGNGRAADQQEPVVPDPAQPAIPESDGRVATLDAVARACRALNPGTPGWHLRDQILAILGEEL